jgi:hypothetical protein
MDLRDRLLPLSESGRLDALRDWLDDLRPGTTLRSARFENLEQPSEALVIHLEADGVGLVTVADDLLAVRRCVLSCYDSNPIRPGARQHPLYVDRGWSEDQTVDVVPPEGMVAVDPPASTVGRTAVASFSASCEVSGDGSFTCTRSFSAKRNRWAPAELARVRGLIDRIVESDQAVVAFRPTASGS